MLKCAPLVALSVALMSVSAGAASLDAIASFSETTGDQPYAPVIFDYVVGRQSVLYTTNTGGAGDCYEDHGCGSVVSLTPPDGAGPWTMDVMRKLKGADGVYPYGAPIVDSFGAIYGVNVHAGGPGCHDDEGCGTIYKFTPRAPPDTGWTYKVIYTFKGEADGGEPKDSLTFDTFGALYGVTYTGGAFGGRGTIFKLSRSAHPNAEWTKTTLYAFQGPEGAHPRSQLTFDSAGALYGVAEVGGSNDKGTVFKLSPPRKAGGPWTINVLHHFGAPGDGALPYARVIFDTKGAIYGTTWKGGVKDRGVAYKLTPPAKPGEKWSYSRYQFEGDSGRVVAGGLVFDTAGALWGTAQRGGPGDCRNQHCGTLYKLIAPKTAGDPWQHEVVAAFDGTNGGKPLVTPLFHRGKIYGTTHYGGTSDRGVVFEYTP